MCGKVTYIVLNINISCIDGGSSAIHVTKGRKYMYVFLCENTCMLTYQFTLSLGEMEPIPANDVHVTVSAFKSYQQNNKKVRQKRKTQMRIKPTILIRSTLRLLHSKPD
jgi:hypothetical protein